MIKFFRRIRQNLLTENKFGKYLLYALGEILLVVIGILIALQLNNRNEQRKDRENEKLVVQTIYDELGQNLEYSTTLLYQIENRIANTLTLMEYTSNPNMNISSSAFDSLMARAFIFQPYTPIKADLDRVSGSAQIDLIRSSKLQQGLSDYKTSIDEAALTYDYAEDDFKLIILPYFIKYYPLKSFILQFGLEVPATSHERNHTNLLTSLEFENLLTVIFADAVGRSGAINKNIELIKEIKSVIEKEYPAIDI